MFLDNGENVAMAALVDDELRVPVALPNQLVPPPPLLWAALGVFRAGAGARMLQGTRAADMMVLRYQLPDGSNVRFSVRHDALVEVELLVDGETAERVTSIGNDPEALHPAEVTYRNLPEYRELELTLESVDYVDPFPADTWTPREP